MFNEEFIICHSWKIEKFWKRFGKNSYRKCLLKVLLSHRLADILDLHFACHSCWNIPWRKDFERHLAEFLFNSRLLTLVWLLWIFATQIWKTNDLFYDNMVLIPDNLLLQDNIGQRNDSRSLCSQGLRFLCTSPNIAQRRFFRQLRKHHPIWIVHLWKLSPDLRILDVLVGN